MTVFNTFLLTCFLFGLAIVILHNTRFGDPDVANESLRELFRSEEDDEDEEDSE